MRREAGAAVPKVVPDRCSTRDALQANDPEVEGRKAQVRRTSCTRSTSVLLPQQGFGLPRQAVSSTQPADGYAMASPAEDAGRQAEDRHCMVWRYCEDGPEEALVRAGDIRSSLQELRRRMDQPPVQGD